MPKHDMRTFVDAEAMSPRERLDRLVEILTRGVLRLVEERSVESRARRKPTPEPGAAPVDGGQAEDTP